MDFEKAIFKFYYGDKWFIDTCVWYGEEQTMKIIKDFIGKGELRKVCYKNKFIYKSVLETDDLLEIKQ